MNKTYDIRIDRTKLHPWLNYKLTLLLKQCAKKGIYLSPLRILALENYEKLNNEGVPCDLITGEEEIINENSSPTILGI